MWIEVKRPAGVERTVPVSLRGPACRRGTAWIGVEDRGWMVTGMHGHRPACRSGLAWNGVDRPASVECVERSAGVNRFGTAWYVVDRCAGMGRRESFCLCVPKWNVVDWRGPDHAAERFMPMHRVPRRQTGPSLPPRQVEPLPSTPLLAVRAGRPVLAVFRPPTRQAAPRRFTSADAGRLIHAGLRRQAGKRGSATADRSTSTHAGRSDRALLHCSSPVHAGRYVLAVFRRPTRQAAPRRLTSAG
jgi:hypothetical protein